MSIDQYIEELQEDMNQLIIKYRESSSSINFCYAERCIMECFHEKLYKALHIQSKTHDIIHRVNIERSNILRRESLSYD